MESIVVGVDESRAAHAALEWTAQRCARRDATVDVVNVVWDLTGGRDKSVAVLADAERVLQEKAPGQTVRFQRAEGGVARTLAERSADADLLVIGVDPHRPLRAALGGWLPVRVAARAEVPVCVVPVAAEDAVADDAAGPVTVGLAKDDSSHAALQFAAREAFETGVPLRVVHAWEHASERAAHEERLDATVRALREQFDSLVITAELEHDSPPEALLVHAPDSSLLVIGTHGHGVLAGGLSAAVGQEILWRAMRPVCVVPPDRDADATG